MRYYVWTLGNGLVTFRTEEEQRAYWATVRGDSFARYWKGPGMDRLTKTVYLLGNSFFNPVTVARNRYERSRTTRGRLFWLAVGQEAANRGMRSGNTAGTITRSR